MSNFVIFSYRLNGGHSVKDYIEPSVIIVLKANHSLHFIERKNEKKASTERDTLSVFYLFASLLQ